MAASNGGGARAGQGKKCPSHEMHADGPNNFWLGLIKPLVLY